VSDLGFWVPCGVKMMSLCHGWGSQPTQTASHIHIRHKQSVWAHWYAVHGHMAVASNSYTHNTWLTFWGSGSLVESKWWYNVGWVWQPIQSAFHIYIRHIQSVWAHWYAVHGHMAAASNSYTHTTLVRFCGSGSLVESKWWYNVMVEADSHPNCFLHPHETYTQCLSTLICCPWA
jgi:hypothetical protein